MTIGNKIRFFRNLRGYTQDELGQKIGLQGDRVRQYENGIRTPKADMLKTIADALDVDVAALSDIDIRSEEDIMHVLFELEDNFSINIEKQDGKTVLVIDNEDSRNSVLNTYLNYWYDKKQVYSLDKYSDAKDPRVIDYRSWRGRFGSNEADFENSIRENIIVAYKDEVAKLAKAKTKPCKTIADLIRLLSSISTDLLIGTEKELQNILNPITSYGFVFDAEKLLNAESLSKEFALFLYEIDHIKSLDCKCYSTINYSGTGLKITFFISIGGFNMVTDMINDWINYCKKSDSYSVLAKKEYEKQFKDELKRYDDATYEQIIDIYGKIPNP